MKTPITAICFLAALACQSPAEEPDPSVAGLEQTAEKFVTAYNQRDAAALAALFTENGEITNLAGDERINGREAIKSRYEAIFADEDAPSIAVEVSSVRFVAPNLAIEDGTVHLTPGGDENEPPVSNTYTAVMLRNDAGLWQIASSRRLTDATDAPGQLASLADAIKGEWSYQDPEGLRLDIAFGWDPSGKFLIGEMLTTAPDAEPQKGSIRIGWDASRRQIVSWIFDDDGGFTYAAWAATDDGWLIRSDGTTGEGESFSATQQLTTDGKETLIWNATNRIIDGVKQPDKTLRLVRPAPAPGES